MRATQSSHARMYQGMAARPFTGHTRAVCRKHGIRGELVPCFVQIARSQQEDIMTMPGMLFETTDVCDRRKPRRSMRSKFITRLFAVGIGAAMLGGGVAIVQNAPEADAITQAQINRYIKSENGIPPCRWEDGSGTPGTPESPCYWNAKTMGDGNGWSFVAMPDGKDKDDDKDIVYLNGPLAERY